MSRPGAPLDVSVACDGSVSMDSITLCGSVCFRTCRYGGSSACTVSCSLARIVSPRTSIGTHRPRGQLERVDELRYPVRCRRACPAYRLVVGRPAGSASHRPEDAGVVGVDDTGSGAGAVAAGYAVSAPVHANGAGITITATAGAVCRDHMPAGVSSDRRATSLAGHRAMARGTQRWSA